jgi:hypothetical protein
MPNQPPPPPPDMGIIYLAVGFVGIVIVLATFLLWALKPASDFESRKLRLAAAMFTGIMLVFIFVALIDVALGNGRQIFDTAVKAMLPLAGVIVGYFFGAGQKASVELPVQRRENDPRDEVIRPN